MTVRRSWIAIAVCVSVGFLMVVPSGTVLSPVASVGAAPGETTLRIGLMGDLSTMNPFIAIEENDLFFASLVYDCLTTYDQDLGPTPNLANSWYVVPETDPELVASGEPYGSVWQYNLTEGASWHDGEPFTAEDVNYSLNLNAHEWVNLWAYQPYAMCINYSEAIDDQTVRVHFCDLVSGTPAPASYGASLLIPILPKHVIQTHSAAELGFSWNGWPLVGTGPFMAQASTLDEFQGGSNVTLVRNPNHHWAADYGKQVRFDRIDLRCFDNDTDMRNALLNGEIDVARFNAPNLARWDSEIRGGSVTDISTMTGLRPDGRFTDLGINMRIVGGPKNDARLDPFLRVALAMATNRTQILETIYRGYAVEGSTLVSPVYPDWHLTLDPADEFQYNPPAAALMLELFGYSDGDSDGIREAGADSLTVLMGWEPEGTPLSFELLVRIENLEDLLVADALKTMYADIGVDLQIVVVDTPTFYTIVYSYTYDMMIGSWSQDPDPNRMLFVETSYAVNGWSDNSYSNVEYDQNYSASLSAMDPADRQLFAQNCQLINYVESPYIVLVYNNQTYARRTDTFNGWGDWNAHPGRSLDAKWGANPLFFDLIPVVANTAPTAAFTVSPSTGTTVTSFEFNASTSSDPEDDVAALEVRWDWENDGTWDTAWTTTKTAQHAFAAAGTHTVALAVRDTGGLEDTATTDVVVSEQVIPEFGTALVPVIATAVLLFALRRRT